MAFTIYTVSDPATVGSVLTSMAMFFGQDSWVGSAIKLALIVSLIVILAKGVTRDGMRLDIMLLQLLVVMGAFIPKTTVTVEQFDNAAPARVVDEVPYAIAIPGSIAGAFALYMTNKIELVMQGVQPNYVTVSGEIGPFTPARTMMWYAMCVTDVTRCMDQNLLQTMHAAARYCGTGSLSAIPFHQKSNVFKTFAEGLDTDGMTMIYTDTKPFNAGGGGGEAVGCADAASYLISLGDDLDSGNPRMFASTFNGIAKNSDIKRYNTAGGTPSSTDEWDDALAKINRVTSSGANINTLSMANMMTYSIAEQFARESKSSLDKTLAIKRDVGLFDWAKSEAEKSLLVTTTAPKFMDILFFIFIAATPIVMFVVAANPASGVKVAGSYVLFGLWTQSWIPMMAIIGGWYQAELHNYPGPQANLGMTPEYMAGMMRHVNTATIAAANMLQTAPYMMFAIMTGSMFAMSSMIAKAAPSAGAGASSEGGSAAAGGGKAGGMLGVPSPGGSAASAGLAQRQAVMAGATSLGGGGLGSDESFVGGGAAASFPGLPSLQMGAAVKSGVAANNEVSAASRASLQKQQASAMADLSSLIKSGSHKIDGAQVAQHMSNSGYQTSYDAKTGMLSANGLSVDMKSGVIDTTTAGTVASGGVSDSTSKMLGLKKLGGAIGAQLQASRAGSTAMSDSISEGKNLSSQGSQSLGSSASVSKGESGSSGSKGSNGFDYASTAQKAKSLSDTFSKIASESQSLDAADKLTKQAASDSSVSSGTKIDGAQIVDGWNARTAGDHGRQSSTGHEAMERVSKALGAALQGPEGAALKEAAIQAQRGMERSDSALGNTTNHDQRAAAAMLQALDDRTRSGATVQQQNEGFTGMASLARAAGIQVSSSALSALESSASQFKQAEDRIGKMAESVKPQVGDAMNAVDARMAGAGAHSNQVASELASNRANAESLNGAANSGAAGVLAAGNAAVAAEAMKAVPSAAPIPGSSSDSLRNQALRNAQDRPLVPLQEELGPVGESITVTPLTKGSGSQSSDAPSNAGTAAVRDAVGGLSAAASEGVSGARAASESISAVGASGAASLQPMVSGLGGAAESGGAVARGLSDAVSGAVGAGTTAAQSIVNVVNGASGSPPTGGNQSSGSGAGTSPGLPTLGITGASLTAGGGSGASGAVTQPPPEVTGKPNANAKAAPSASTPPSKSVGPR